MENEEENPAAELSPQQADDASRVDDDNNICVEENNAISSPLVVEDKKMKSVEEENSQQPKKKRPKREHHPSVVDDPNNNIHERRCEKCQISKPRSKYNKKQWNKIYGGWQCLDCSVYERKQQRLEANQLIQSLKQRQHDQKLREQSTKKDGIFMNLRPCFQCGQNKPRAEYSGKQWKKLYRQCQPCVDENGFQNTLLEPTHEKKGINHNDGSKYCSGCKESKLKDQFPPQQWSEPAIKDANRLCTICWEEEGQAKREHLQLSESHNNKDNNEKRCYACHQFLDHSAYSSKQLTKKYGMCISCVDVVRLDRKEDLAKGKEYSTRPCSICGIQKTSDEFGRGQWKRADPRCKVCSVALVQKMDKHRQLEKDYNNAEQQQQQQQQQQFLAGEDNDTTTRTTTTTEGGSFRKKRRCFECGKFLEQDKYSLRQWTKTYPTCVDHADDGKKKASEI